MTTSTYAGQRLSYDNAPCTVRYFGPVAGTNGDWIGVEWDSSSRGRNAGDAKGVQYFECRSKEAKPASFIRPGRQPDEPRTFLEALKYKYASSDGPAITDSGLAYEIGTKPIRISGKQVEEVGFDKISKKLATLDQLKVVILDGLRVQYSREQETDVALLETEIAKTCPKIVQLDLGKNLFEQLDEIGFICAALNGLADLRLDGNRLRELWKSPEQLNRLQKFFSKIGRLGLGQTLLTWQEILRTCECFISLTNLRVSHNEMSVLDAHLPTRSLRNLTALDLESNHFGALSDLAPLAGLEKLKVLLLNFNNISKACDPLSDSASLKFGSQLKRLELAFNEIADWDLVDQLPLLFPGLENLRISHNPLYDQSDFRSADDGYLLTIARIKDLKTLNFSPINSKDRLEAESFYLANIRKELEQVDEDEEAKVTSKHPRFAELCEEYGAPAVKRQRGAIDNSNLLKFRFFVQGAEINRANPVFERQLFRYYTVYDLFFYAAQSLGVNPLNIHLYWITKAQQAKIYQQENTTEVMWSEKRPVEQNEAGWATTEVELSRTTKLLDLVFYDEVTSIRVQVDHSV